MLDGDTIEGYPDHVARGGCFHHRSTCRCECSGQLPERRRILPSRPDKRRTPPGAPPPIEPFQFIREFRNTNVLKSGSIRINPY